MDTPESTQTEMNAEQIQQPAPDIAQGVEMPAAGAGGEPPKRRRGRPPKNPALQEQTVNGDTAAKRGPGRPKKNPGMSGDELMGLSRQIMGLHMIAAQATGIAELQINETEAGMLATSIDRVSQEYGLSMSGKTGAMLQLLGTAAIIYMPRLGVINAKIKQKQEEKRRATVVDIQTGQ